jgi:long-chain acyl-CoA synthetase
VTDLVKFLQETAKRFAAEPAVAGGGLTLTYGELAERACRGAAHLRSMGLTDGDAVLLATEARPEWPAAFFAIVHAGCVAVPIPEDLPRPVASAAIAHIEAKACIVNTRTAGLGDGLPSIGIEQLFSMPPMEPIVHPLAMLGFTSGSTSRPRAVELTHRNLLGDLEALRQARAGAPGDSFLSMLPPAHLFELMGGLLGPLSCGARVVYPGAPLPNRLVEALREARITHAMAVPALVAALYGEVVEQLVDTGFFENADHARSPSFTAERLRSELGPQEVQRVREGVRSRIGDTFHTLVVGGAALDPAFARVGEAMGICVETGYGLTEAGPIVSVGRSGECPPGSVGRPLPGIEVRIADADEILVRGPNVMRGYFKDPDATADALRGGWLHTGDCGTIDDSGFLFVTGRIKEAIVTAAGTTIHPGEVEPYYRSPLFAEACIAAVAGKSGNDRIALFVVPVPDATAEQIEEQFADLRAASPARYRVERLFCRAEPLPRTATGKVRRALLRDAEDRER